jgi:hypothetical protein
MFERFLAENNPFEIKKIKASKGMEGKYSVQIQKL